MAATVPVYELRVATRNRWVLQNGRVEVPDSVISRTFLGCRKSTSQRFLACGWPRSVNFAGRTVERRRAGGAARLVRNFLGLAVFLLR